MPLNVRTACRDGCLFRLNTSYAGLRRLYLSPYETTPTYRNVHNKFSVSYMLNLVLVDEEDRRYFKQQEIVLYRLVDSAQVSSEPL